MRIYVVRHGQDTDNAAGILNGRRDTYLTRLGRCQALLVAEKLKALGLVFNGVYSSPLKRTYQTACLISTFLELGKPLKAPELIEREFGIMTGKPVADIPKRCAPDIIRTEKVVYFTAADGAETFPCMMERAEKFLSEIREKHRDGTLLFVTHGDFGKMIYAAFYGLDWKNVLTAFHFGNSEMLLLSEDTPPEKSLIFTIEQHNG